MDQLEIPRVVITTRCNLSCAYCAGPKQKIKEVSVDRWVHVLKKPEYRKIIFTGGEPLAYTRIYELIHLLEKPCEIYTNLEIWKEDAILKLPKETVFNISLHDQTKDSRKFAAKLKDLSSRYRISLHRVKKHAEMMANRPGIKGYDITVSKDQQILRMNKEPHFCHIKRVLYGPDSKRYPCCALMGISPITEDPYYGTICKSPRCLPCDLFGQENSDGV